MLKIEINIKEKTVEFSFISNDRRAVFKKHTHKEINDRNLDINEGVELFKTPEDLDAKSVDYKHLQYKWGDNEA